MNLTDAADIKINGKEVQQIKIDGNIVYTAGYRIRMTTDKTYILTGETATLTVKCEDLPFTQIELYNVIDMVRTKIADLTTDSNGRATYTYTGDGSGEIGFLAKYDGKESNRVIIDDYIPVYHPVLSYWSSNITYGHAPTGLLVSARDQHDERGPNGVTIVFKEGDTVLDTIVTAGSTPGTIGTATFDLNSLDVGVHTIYAMIGSTSSKSTATITVNKANTSLDISVPVLVYSDNFSVTGVLKDSYNTPISGARVRLKWNVGDNEYSATATTNASGEVTFATQAPTSITDYTFQLEYDGNTNYNASASSVIQRTVGKETSVLVVTSPVSGAVVSTDSVVVSGTATDDDNTPLTGKIVYLFINDSYAGTTTVGSDGSFSKTISGLSAGSNSIRCEIVATTTHTAARQVITVNRSTFDGLADLELIDGNQILSYADEQKTPGSQYATLETQLMNGDSPAAIEGVEVGFWDFTDESSPVLLGSDNTDTDGKASFTYESQGVGDVPIKAVCGSFVSKTFVVEDCYYFDPQTENKNRYTVASGGANISYGSNGCTITGTQSTTCLVKNTALSLPSEYTATFEVTACSGDTDTSRNVNCGGVVFDDWFTDWRINNNTSETYRLSTTGKLSSNLSNIQANDVVKIVRENGTMKQYINDVLVSTDSNISHTGYFQHRSYQRSGSVGRSITVKNLKIKPL